MQRQHSAAPKNKQTNKKLISAFGVTFITFHNNAQAY